MHRQPVFFDFFPTLVFYAISWLSRSEGARHGVLDRRDFPVWSLWNFFFFFLRSVEPTFLLINPSPFYDSMVFFDFSAALAAAPWNLSGFPRTLLMFSLATISPPHHSTKRNDLFAKCWVLRHPVLGDFSLSLLWPSTCDLTQLVQFSVTDKVMP